ncbi:hypothetical protein [Actinomadura macrotermitis]|uniref:Carboxypeptidase regulatory-like domain-containing protein n=1 Tax=Actinomadura macrotermitis TaxID=2585200 RepID=A0A7K0C2M8_9ACTN|nr:hypothetical protein [Actinomadura macrotermitis]MQY07372.1 hypothetical protein [Actinomadura macrotermitis]
MRRTSLGVLLLTPAMLLLPVPAASADVQGLRITLDPIARSAPGAQAVLAGKVEKLEDGVWKPGDNSIGLGFEADALTQTMSGGLAVNDADGRFSTTFAFTRTTRFKVHASADGKSADAQVTALPTALRPLTLTMSKFSLPPSGLLSVSGRAGDVPWGSLELQHAYRGSSTWKTVRRFPARSVTAELKNYYYADSGSYRLYYKGDSDFKAAASSSKSVLRWNTRLSAKFSPRKLHVGKKVKATGTLLRYSPSKRKHVGYAGRKVQLVFRCKGAKTWYNGGWAKTDKKGHYTRYSKTYCDSYWAVVFWGATDTWSTDTADTYVNTYGRLRSSGVRATSAAFPGAVVRPAPLTAPAAGPASQGR